MKASKFSDAQTAFILKHGPDVLPVADICRKAGISYRRNDVVRAFEKVCTKSDYPKTIRVDQPSAVQRWISDQPRS